MIRLIITVLLIIATGVIERAQADADTDAVTLNRTRYVIKKVNQKNASEPSADFTDAAEGSTPKACVDAYRDMYSKPTVSINVTLGYWDSLGNPQDKIRRDEWAQRLMNPCPKVASNALATCDNSKAGIGAEQPNCLRAAGTCGFTHPNEDNLNLFQKTEYRPDGKPHVVKVSLVSSSASTDDKANRSQMGAGQLQATQTHEAEENFFGGLKNADAVIYVGHARKGGGPSFEPPKLSADGITPDYPWYQAHPVNEQRMVSALKSADQPPRFLGLFACESGPHFGDDVRSSSPNSGLVTTDKLIENEVAFAQAYGALDSLLAMRCSTEFNESMNTFKYFGEDCADPLHSDAKISTSENRSAGSALCLKAAQATLTNFFKDGAPVGPATPAQFRTPGAITDPVPMRPPEKTSGDRVRFKTPQGTSGVN